MLEGRSSLSLSSVSCPVVRVDTEVLVILNIRRRRAKHYDGFNSAEGEAHNTAIRIISEPLSLVASSDQVANCNQMHTNEYHISAKSAVLDVTELYTLHLED